MPSQERGATGKMYSQGKCVKAPVVCDEDINLDLTEGYDGMKWASGPI